MRFGLVFLNFFLNDDAVVLLAFILKKEKLKQSKFLIGGGTLRVLVSLVYPTRHTQPYAFCHFAPFSFFPSMKMKSSTNNAYE